MENSRVLSSRIIKRAFNQIHKFSVSLVFGICLSTVAPAFATNFVNTHAMIGASAEYTLQVQHQMTKEASVVFDHDSLGTVARSLSASLELPIYVDASISDQPLSYFTSEKPLGLILNDITRKTNAFFVYRDGFLQFATHAQLELELSRPVSPLELQQLADLFYKTDSEMFIGTTRVHLSITRGELINFRKFLVSEQITAQILATDLVINGFSVI